MHSTTRLAAAVAAMVSFTVPASAQQESAPHPRSEAGFATLGSLELGFQLRSGVSSQKRGTFGSSVVASRGPLVFGLSADSTSDLDWNDDRRSSYALSGFAGARAGSALAGTPLRLELVGEVGWEHARVRDRIRNGAERYWSEGSRSFPVAGVRGGAAMTFARHGYLGLGAYLRQGLAGQLSVSTDAGRRHVGGLTAGVYLFGGGDWALGGR